MFRAAGRRQINSAIQDPELRRKVMPTDEVGCKRVMLTDDWYPTLTKPNVDLVTERVAEDDLAYIPFTYPFNISGQPAISLPLGWSDDGLPIGVQLVGQPYGEARLIALAAQIERAQPWQSRYPAGGA